MFRHPPIANEPTSPIKIDAGNVLNHKNQCRLQLTQHTRPRVLPNLGCTRFKYSATLNATHSSPLKNVSVRPAIYAKIKNVAVDTTVGPIASPSRPSVKFTAFEVPTIGYKKGQNQIQDTQVRVEDLCRYEWNCNRGVKLDLQASPKLPSAASHSANAPIPNESV